MFATRWQVCIMVYMDEYTAGALLNGSGITRKTFDKWLSIGIFPRARSIRSLGRGKGRVGYWSPDDADLFGQLQWLYPHSARPDDLRLGLWLLQEDHHKPAMDDGGAIARLLVTQLDEIGELFLGADDHEANLRDAANQDLPLIFAMPPLDDPAFVQNVFELPFENLIGAGGQAPPSAYESDVLHATLAPVGQRWPNPDLSAEQFQRIQAHILFRYLRTFFGLAGSDHYAPGWALASMREALMSASTNGIQQAWFGWRRSLSLQIRMAGRRKWTGGRTEPTMNDLLRLANTEAIDRLLAHPALFRIMALLVAESLTQAEAKMGRIYDVPLILGTMAALLKRPRSRQEKREALLPLIVAVRPAPWSDWYKVSPPKPKETDTPA